MKISSFIFFSHFKNNYNFFLKKQKWMFFHIHFWICKIQNIFFFFLLNYNTWYNKKKLVSFLVPVSCISYINIQVLIFFFERIFFFLLIYRRIRFRRTRFPKKMSEDQPAFYHSILYFRWLLLKLISGRSFLDNPLYIFFHWRHKSIFQYL